MPSPEHLAMAGAWDILSQGGLGPYALLLPFSSECCFRPETPGALPQIPQDSQGVGIMATG